VCKKRISIIYPFFELITGILFLLSYRVFGISIEFIIAITFISILIIISISDVRYYIIPDEVLIVGIIILLLEYVIKYFIKDLSFFNSVIYPIINGLASFAILYLFKILGDFLFKKESLGGGDIKLLFLKR
jgi:prepilin signal peptidase PulO-like enzyme (type II secretory pathway)